MVPYCTVAPPKALDDDDMAFLHQLEDQDRLKAKELKRQHENDLKLFVDATTKVSTSMPKAKKAKRIDVVKTKEPELNVAFKKVTRKEKKRPKAKQAKTSSTATCGLVSVGYASDSSSS